jgi:hypothetical protein
MRRSQRLVVSNYRNRAEEQSTVNLGFFFFDTTVNLVAATDPGPSALVCAVVTH